MAFFRKRGEKHKYYFVDDRCIGRECWAPGLYQHRGATLSGSRNTGSPDSPMRLRNAYHGCPEGPMGEHTEPCAAPGDTAEAHVSCTSCGGTGQTTVVGLPLYNADLARKRKAEGWKRA